MSNTLTELKEKALQLSEAERAELALFLIGSLDGPADVPFQSTFTPAAQMTPPQRSVSSFRNAAISAGVLPIG